MPPATPTIGDLIAAVDAAQAKIADANRVVVEATNALASANTSLSDLTIAANQADTDLGAGLASAGPIFAIQADGRAAIYSPDGAGSYSVTYARPIETAVSPEAPTATPLRR